MTDRNSTIQSTPKQVKKRKLLTTDEFIRRAKLVHGERYNYDTVKYIKITAKVEITCEAHGVFEQTPHNHLKGANCPTCGSEKREEYYASIRKQAANEFEDRANQCHNGFYDYSMVDYKNSSTKVKIVCPTHGVFSQEPHHHIMGAGCYDCARKRIRKAVGGRAIKAASVFEAKARKLHGNKYNYEKVKYKNSATKVEITCPHHGLFSQTPSGHLSSKGCPDCGREIASGWSRSQFVAYANEVSKGVATIYIIKCWNESETFYKIGVTTQSVSKRFHNNKSMPYSFEVVKTAKARAEKVYNTEIQSHRLNKESHYTPKLSFGGSVLECFTNINQDTLLLLDAI